MPAYWYQAYSPDGESESGTVEAGNEQIAYEVLHSRGLAVFDLTPQGGAWADTIPWYRRDISFSGGRLPNDEQAIIADLLATLFSASLPEREVVRVAELATENRKVKRHFERVRLNLENGGTLARAFEENNRLFSPIFASFLQLAATANAAAPLLKSLANFLRRQNDTRQEIVSALIYPAILIAAAVVLLFIVIFFLAPNLAPLFGSVGKAPPATLAVLMQANFILSSYWPIVVAGLAGLLLLMLAALTHPPLRARITRLPMALPGIGRLISLSVLTRMTEATVLLLQAGETLPEALRTAARVMGSRTGHAERFADAADAIEGGARGASVFETETSIPPAFCEMFRLGEETNRLPENLTAAAEALAAQTERQSQRLLALMTPAITLVLGLGVGFLIYTLMGAMLEINDLAV